MKTLIQDVRYGVRALRRNLSERLSRRDAWSLRVEPAKESLMQNVRAMLVVLLAAVGFVLLIVCVNVVLATLRSAVPALMPADLPRLSEVHYDARVVALAFLLSLATGLLFGLTPALQASHFDPSADLKEGGRTGIASKRHSRFRNVLVSGEIALSVVLSIGAGLLIRSFWDMLQVSPGMDPNNVVLARIWIPVPNNPQVNRYLKAPQREILIRELLRRASTLGDVQHAAMGSGSAIPFLANVRNSFSVVCAGCT
jgi:multisubunit Na+/H+ antiporter MnhB subunit